MIDAQAFKNAMRCFPTGVTVITTYVDGTPHGFTANAFASVSVDPPSVLICVNRNARSHALIAASQKFCVNILRVEQQEIAEHFSTSGDDEQFSGIDYARADDGAPHITNSLAWLDCVVSEEHTVATHTIFVGTVIRGGSDSQGVPLTYFQGRFIERTPYSPE